MSLVIFMWFCTASPRLLPSLKLDLHVWYYSFIWNNIHSSDSSLHSTNVIMIQLWADLHVLNVYPQIHTFSAFCCIYNNTGLFGIQAATVRYQLRFFHYGLGIQNFILCNGQLANPLSVLILTILSGIFTPSLNLLLQFVWDYFSFLFPLFHSYYLNL